ncbi:MAG TPA: hypothetical protein VN841_06900 [Bryobacteraceae bacterium]|nr:hypothetical protein [Bryobacteraceae bacterium]
MRAITLTILMSAGALLAADTAADLSQAKIDEIIQKFAAKESEFSKARDNYTYRQTARIQELDPGGTQMGRWEMVSDIVFNGEGKRTEHVVNAPVPSLSHIILTPEDMQDLKDVQPFVLTSEELPKYLIRYLGKEAVDEIDCYVFAVKPKKLEQGHRYFQGEVWVDDQDLQIVKSYGRGVGVIKHSEDNQFPKFETYREQIDGKYWFPTYTIANDTLHFKDSDQRIRQTVRYEDYKQFKAETKITFGDEVDTGKQNSSKDGKAAPPSGPAPAQTPAKKQ